MRGAHRFILVIALMAVTWTVRAQAPGFLGRRYAVSYNCFFMPASPSHYGRGQSRNYAGNDGFYFNVSHLATVERTMSRRSVIGLGASLMRAGDPRSRNFYRTEYGRSSIQCLGIVFTSKMYPFLSKGWIAPLGPYFRFDLSYLSAKGDFEGRNATSRDQRQHNGIAIALGVGATSVIKGRLLMDYGARISFTDLPTAANNYNTLEQEDARILFATDLIKFWLGLGVLLGK